MSFNQISAIPETLEACTKLHSLHLGKNAVSEIPSGLLAATTSLQNLHLFRNKIEELPAELGGLKELKRMSLSGNNLKTLPDVLGNCTQLEELYLNNNAKFSKMPESVGHLRKLKELSARSCKALKALPSSIGQGCVNLTELDLRVPKKPKGICKLTADVASLLQGNGCKIKGAQVKKGKKGGGKKKK